MKNIKRYIKKYLLDRLSSQFLALVKTSFHSSRFKLLRNVVVNELPKESVLVIAPHPDDEIIGMGGSINLHLEKQSKVTVLYMTDGRNEAGLNISKDRIVEVRKQEAQLIGKRFDINQIFWEIKDGQLESSSTTIDKMIKVLNDIQPDTIYLPSMFDFHHDHFMANKILVDSINESEIGLKSIVGYEVWSNIPFPNYIVDISSCYEMKKEMLSYYKVSQTNYDYFKLCEYRNSLHYALYIKVNYNAKANGYAEGFYRVDSEIYQEIFYNYVAVLK
tara:strand:+ start:333 stop:1157 length:825 start_codon:yes stop_codon:yes gene_type:complete